MVMLVSLRAASEHLRRDTNDDDQDLALKIEAASQAVLNYIDKKDFLETDGEVFIGSDDEPQGVPTPIQQAVLILVGQFYADRDGVDFRGGSGDERLSRIILPRAVHFLLDPYRKPRLG